MQILLVDDSSFARTIAARILTIAGHTVTEAADAARAVRCARATQFDLVLVDFSMPGDSGVDLIHRFRASVQYASTPLVMLTAETRNEIVLSARHAGVSGWLVKPFELAKFELVMKAIDLPVPVPEQSVASKRAG